MYILPLAPRAKPLSGSVSSGVAGRWSSSRSSSLVGGSSPPARDARGRRHRRSRSIRRLCWRVINIRPFECVRVCVCSGGSTRPTSVLSSSVCQCVCVCVCVCSPGRSTRRARGVCVCDETRALAPDDSAAAAASIDLRYWETGRPESQREQTRARVSVRAREWHYITVAGRVASVRCARPGNGFWLGCHARTANNDGDDDAGDNITDTGAADAAALMCVLPVRVFHPPNPHPNQPPPTAPPPQTPNTTQTRHARGS